MKEVSEKAGDKMKEVSEKVLNKIRTAKKSANLSLDFDEKMLEKPEVSKVMKKIRKIFIIKKHTKRKKYFF